MRENSGPEARMRLAGAAHDALCDAIRQAMSEARTCRTEGDCPGCTRVHSAALEAGENYARAAILAASGDDE